MLDLMEAISWRTVAEAQETVEWLLRAAEEKRLHVLPGSFSMGPGGGRHGGHPWWTNYLVVLTAGAGWAIAGDGRRQPISAGDAAFWPTGDWFAVDIPSGTAVTALTLYGDDLNINEVRSAVSSIK